MSADVHLDYAVILQSRLDMLNNWKDIVRSVMLLFLTDLHPYDQNASVPSFANPRDIFPMCVQATISAASTSNISSALSRNTFNKTYAFTFTPLNLSISDGGVDRFLAKRLMLSKEEISLKSQFYLLERLK